MRAICVALTFTVGLLASAAHAQQQPSAAMMEPVHGLVRFMSTLRRGEQPRIGQTHGKHFEEQGAWSFVLEQEAERRQIVGYGWGVTSAAVTPP